MRSISIVIPVYDAEATIGDLCRRLITLYAPGRDLQIVLVNDCSKDKSDEICRALHAEFPDSVCYLRLAKNFGEHNAVMAGLRRARGEWCVIMDDDFQNPPEEVAALLERMDDGHDVIYAAYDVKKDPWYRRAASRLNDWVAIRALGKPKGLYVSSFKAVNRFLVSEITRYQGPEPYIDALILRSTNAIGTAAVRHDPRVHGRSGYTLGKLVGLWSNMLIAFSVYPIRIIGAIGLIVLVAGLVMLVRTAWSSMTVAYMDDPTEVESLRALTVFLRGLTLTAVGIIGEYVGRLNARLGHNPQFIVREELPARPSVPVPPVDFSA